MRDGTFKFYTYQHKKILETEWLKPKSELKPVEDKGWHLSSWDSFGHAIDPWDDENYGHNLYKEFSDENHEVWSKTGFHGLWSFESAERGLFRLRDANDRGEFDFRDPYNKICQGSRYLFRIIMMEVSQKTTVVQG